MIERIIATPDLLGREVRARLERSASAAVAARRACAIAIPGGSVAEAFFPALVDADVQWDSVDLLWCDERVAPAGDPALNWTRAWQLWLQHLRNSPRVHRMPVDVHPAERAAEAYERVLSRVLAECGGALDVALLGMGADGHIASLFPGNAAFTAQDERTVRAVHGAPKPPPERLTLTLPVLAQARSVVLAAFGGEKASIVRDVLEGESAVPAALLLRQCSNAVVMMDPAAASLLENLRSSSG